MDNESIYIFDGEFYEELKEKTFEDIDGDELKKELIDLRNTLKDLILGKQKELLDSRGFVLAVNGSWGTGKSTATWALINELKKELQKDECRPVVIDRSLLPFGNISESISTFLNDFAIKLRGEKLIDIREDIDQFILESTPANESTGITASLFGFVSLSRNFKRSRRLSSPSILIEKFKILRNKNKNKPVIIVLDDLDRLRPGEIVYVLRMVEKLRMLPGLIVILPIYKKIISEAIKENLKLDNSSAATFLRKLTDNYINIENKKEDLEKTFKNTVKSIIGNNDKTINWDTGEGAILFSDLVWYMLVHIIIISEVLSGVMRGDAKNISTAEDNSDLYASLVDGSKSNYLMNILKLFRRTQKNNREKKDRTNNLYPMTPETYHRLPNKIVSIGDRYRYLSDGQNGQWNRELKDLLRAVNISEYVYLNKEISEELTRHAILDKEGLYNKDLLENKAFIFTEVLVPLIEASKVEPVLTDNYKRREVNILARRILSKLNGIELKRDGDAEYLKQIFNLVKIEFENFRG